MDIYAVIQQDHEGIRATMAKTLRARSPERRDALVAELRQAVALHVQTEAATWHQALLAFPDLKAQITETREAYDAAQGMIDTLARLTAEPMPFLSLFDEVQDALEHLMREEEEKVFPLSRHYLSNAQAEMLGERMRLLEDDYVDGRLLAAGVGRHLSGSAYY